ncbi:MAG: GNAT family N-acetyltransferase, partial [Aestuariivirga sp.]|nr:GNAT family N-acetyltransferase [Aestuariivirga sp.]
MDEVKSRAEVWKNFSADVGQWALLGFGAWAIEEIVNGIYVGQVSLNFPEDFPEHELGWQVWEEFEGKGFAFEAAVLARGFAFNELGWSTVVSYIDPKNERSIRLAERMGAVLDGDAATPNNEACLVYRHLR